MYKNSNQQKFRSTKIQICKNSDIQKFRCTKIQVYKNSDIQIYKNSDDIKLVQQLKQPLLLNGGEFPV